jgi:hypothetical protein
MGIVADDARGRPTGEAKSMFRAFDNGMGQSTAATLEGTIAMRTDLLDGVVGSSLGRDIDVQLLAEGASEYLSNSVRSRPQVRNVDSRSHLP